MDYVILNTKINIYILYMIYHIIICILTIIFSIIINRNNKNYIEELFTNPKLFNKIYVINLKRHNDRKKYMIKLLKKHNIFKYTKFIDAIDGSKLKYKNKM